MSHKRKDTFVTSEWATHLRPDGKRKYHKAERRVAKSNIENLSEEEVCADDLPIVGLNKGPKKKKSKRKRFGVRTYWQGKPPESLFSFWKDGHTDWYKTEKARDDAFDKLQKDLERVKACRENNESQFKTIGCIYVWGDTIEKMER